MRYLITAFFFVTLLAPLISLAQEKDQPVITLSRGMCEGTCPAYTLKLFADGYVNYVGGAFAKEQGFRSDTISVDTVRALLSEANRIAFENLDSEYGRGIVDAPSASVSILINGHTKQVTDFGGRNTPQALREFQAHIDRACKSARWIER